MVPRIRFEVLANVIVQKASSRYNILASKSNYTKSVPTLLSLPYVHLRNCQATSSSIERSFSIMKNILRDNRPFKKENVFKYVAACLWTCPLLWKVASSEYSGSPDSCCYPWSRQVADKLSDEPHNRPRIKACVSWIL